MICFSVGKWNEFTCDAFYEKLSGRMQLPTARYMLDIFTDGNKQNIAAIHNHFPAGSVNYGVKKRVYEGQNIVGIVHRKVLGNPSRKEIAINHVDGLCSKIRERVSCFTRKARSFAKRCDDLNHRFEIFGVSHNFIEKKRRLTPAMREGIATKPLDWSRILHARLSMLK